MVTWSFAVCTFCSGLDHLDWRGSFCADIGESLFQDAIYGLEFLHQCLGGELELFFHENSCVLAVQEFFHADGFPQHCALLIGSHDGRPIIPLLRFH
jgi:hypothetical protein